MYTATLKSKSFKPAQRRIEAVITVTNGEETFDQPFSFALNTEVDDMKRAVNAYLNELNGATGKTDALTDLTPAPELPEEAPSQGEQDKQVWQADRAKLATVMELVRDGVFDGTETQVTALQTKVKTNFKAEYLN